MNQNEVKTNESVDCVETVGKNAEQVSQKQGRTMLKSIMEQLIPPIIVFIMLKLVICPYIIPTESMDPTIKAGSFAFAWRVPYLLGDPVPEYGDILTFDSKESGKILIKRVVGLPGDKLEFKDGKLVRNGEVIEEEYAVGTTEPGKDEEYVVPEGHVFFMGDNREHSADSREFRNPYIPLKDIQAKYLFALEVPFLKER